MGYLVETNIEVLEILNAYPFLKERFLLFNVDLSKLKDGESFLEFCQKIGMGKDEIKIFIHKLNVDIKYYLKTGKLPSFNLKNESEVFNHDDLKLEEDE